MVQIKKAVSPLIATIVLISFTIAIDKEQLGLKEFSTEKVSLDQIPDLAKMKSFIIWFN